MASRADLAASLSCFFNCTQSARYLLAMRPCRCFSVNRSLTSPDSQLTFLIHQKSDFKHCLYIHLTIVACYQK